MSLVGIAVRDNVDDHVYFLPITGCRTQEYWPHLSLVTLGRVGPEPCLDSITELALMAEVQVNQPED